MISIHDHWWDDHLCMMIIVKHICSQCNSVFTRIWKKESQHYWIQLPPWRRRACLPVLIDCGDQVIKKRAKAHSRLYFISLYDASPYDTIQNLYWTGTQSCIKMLFLSLYIYTISFASKTMNNKHFQVFSFKEHFSWLVRKYLNFLFPANQKYSRFNFFSPVHTVQALIFLANQVQDDLFRSIRRILDQIMI